MRHKILPAIIGFVLGALGCYLVLRGDLEDSHRDSLDSISGQQSPPVVQSVTSVQVKPKDNQGDPDVVLSQTYVANINGEKVVVPVAVPKRTNDTAGKPISPTGSPQLQGQIKQEFDLTPLLSLVRPKWEVGAGVVCLQRKYYGSVSIQRNYKHDKALEVTYVTDRTTKGVMVQHKWLLK